MLFCVISINEAVADVRRPLQAYLAPTNNNLKLIDSSLPVYCTMLTISTL